MNSLLLITLHDMHKHIQPKINLKKLPQDYCLTSFSYDMAPPLEFTMIRVGSFRTRCIVPWKRLPTLDIEELRPTIQNVMES